MKLNGHFDEFLKSTVNLNQTRIDTLETRVGVIKKFIKDSAYVSELVRFSAQGSWAHKTIIRPQKDGQEFDADLVMFLKPIDDWEPKDYIIELRRIFANSGFYSDKVGMKSRCVTLDYAGDFHLDIVPVIVRESWFDDDTFEVCNRNTNEFEPTDGDGFLNWWNSKCSDVGGNNLRKVARLLKYVRDAKQTFAVKSVLFTTLIGSRIGVLDSLGLGGDFSDVPSSLKTVVGRLDDYLQENEDMPQIENPALEGESFTRNWSDENYRNFRNKIHQYREWIDDAYGEEDWDESIRKWRRVFGDAFAKSEVVSKAASAVDSVVERLGLSGDIVQAVKQLGAAILVRIPSRLPHVQKLGHKPGKNISLRISANIVDGKNGPILRPYTCGEVIGKVAGIEFQAALSNGMPISNDYEVKWQVVNTGHDAKNRGCTRGGFEKSHAHAKRYEATEYRGAHWVQAFLINKRTKLRDGESERFFVVVE